MKHLRTRTMAGLDFPRFEHLLAAAFQKGSMPGLDGAISIGRSELLEIGESSR